MAGVLYDTILQGDALTTLKTLPSESVQCVVTSPPYWNLRDYGVPGQLGLEAKPEEYVAHMVEVFAEVRRVLRSDGTLWLNIGDSYAGSGCGARDPERWPKQSRNDHMPVHAKKGSGLKPKDLIGIPWMLAFALRTEGWYLRSDIIWHKPNPMPESVIDRPTKAHEYLFLLTKSASYFYDTDAIRESWADTRQGRDGTQLERIRNRGGRVDGFTKPNGIEPSANGGRNKRSVWTVATEPYAGAHFATFPSRLIEPCILAGTSPRACETCGAPWERQTERVFSAQGGRRAGPRLKGLDSSNGWNGFPRGITQVETLGWRPTCSCERNTGTGKSIVLDPFFGAGTVGMVARRHSRAYLGLELNESYIALAQERIASEIQPVLWSIA